MKRLLIHPGIHTASFPSGKSELEQIFSFFWSTHYFRNRALHNAPPTLPEESNILLFVRATDRAFPNPIFTAPGH